jgi:integrase
VIKLTPAAGTAKTGKTRVVPLHGHLIEQGFLDHVRDRGEGPLFYNPNGKKDGASDPLNPKRHPAEIIRRRLADWVRKLGVTDEELSPMHGWRHTFKARADRADISERMSDYITGHAPRTVGAKYGAPTVEDTLRQKFKRWRN